MAYLNGYRSSCCNACENQGLGGIADQAITASCTPEHPCITQRFLNTGEIIDFLFRHPVIAAQVTATKAAMKTIGYEQLNTPPAWYEFDVNIGLLPSQGVEVQDDKYGRVIVFPAPNGNIYFNGFIGPGGPAPGTINAPPYESPTVPPGTEAPCDWLCTLDKYKNGAIAIVFGLIALEVFRTVKRK